MLHHVSPLRTAKTLQVSPWGAFCFGGLFVFWFCLLFFGFGSLPLFKHAESPPLEHSAPLVWP